MLSLDDGLTRRTLNTSPTVRDIFALKSSIPVYAFPFINTFCHLINSSVAEFYDRTPFVMPTLYGERNQYFYGAQSLRDYQPRFENDSLAHETETSPPPAIKLVFQEVSG